MMGSFKGRRNQCIPVILIKILHCKLLDISKLDHLENRIKNKVLSFGMNN